MALKANLVPTPDSDRRGGDIDGNPAGGGVQQADRDNSGLRATRLPPGVTLYPKRPAGFPTGRGFSSIGDG